MSLTAFSFPADATGTPIPSAVFPSPSAGHPPPPTPQQVKSYEFVLITSLVLVTWEILVHGFQDLDYLRMKGWWRRPVFWAYFLQRYGAVAVIGAQAATRIGTPPSCVADGYVSMVVGGVIVLPAISLIYLYRVCAIWNHNKLVKYTLSFMWLIVWGASCSAPFGQRAAKLPSGACTIVKNEKFTSAGFIANAVYDGTVFLLTLWKLIANRRQYKDFKSPVQTILLRDGVLYFAVSVAIGITDIVFLEAVSPPSVASTIIPLHFALASIMTTRLVNNVFYVVKEDPKLSKSGAKTSQANVTIGSWRRPGAGNETALVVGTGVGTGHYEIPDKLSDDYSERGTDEQKDAKGAYGIPIQVSVAREVETV